jgi:hypothetical protein
MLEIDRIDPAEGQAPALIERFLRTCRNCSRHRGSEDGFDPSV